MTFYNRLGLLFFIAMSFSILKDHMLPLEQVLAVFFWCLGAAMFLYRRDEA